MEERTRHRAVGAVVLLLAAAVVFPLVLKSSPPGDGGVASPDPTDPPPESPDRIRITSFGNDEEVLVPPEAGDLADSSLPPVESDPGDPGDAAPAAGWAVQIGSFAHPGNATRLKDQIAARGYRVVTERVRVANGKTRVRVLVGPDRTRAAAAAQRSRLKREDSIEGFLVRFPG